MTVLADSDILIEVSRARDKTLMARWRELGESENEVAYSPVSAAEVWASARTAEFDATTKLLDSLRCLPIDSETGVRAGRFMRQYRNRHSLALGDALIAATAVITGAALWTRNRKHFPMKELSFF